MGGAGKSTLATRLARKLETDGFTPLAISTPEGTPLGPASFLESFRQAFLDAGLKDEYAMLGDASIPPADRLRYVVGALNRNRFLLVLDNFEVNLDEQSRKILDQEVAAFYGRLLTHLIGDSRAIITSRYEPADAPLSSATGHEEALGDFPLSSFLKFLMRDPLVERRYYEGELPHGLLVRVHELLGGAPRFLLQVRTVLRDMPAEDLEAEINAVSRPAASDSGKARDLAAARDQYCERIFTSRLYYHLGEDCRRALSRVAVYSVPVNLGGLAAVAGSTVDRLKEFTTAWRDYGLAYSDRERGPSELWSIYALLRGWLLAPDRISHEERISAHRAAGKFLRDLDEADREREIGLSWVDCLLESRSQFLAADECEAARAVTDLLSGSMIPQGLYREVIRLNSGVLDCSQHPGPMSWIARAYSDLAEYSSARAWYERCLDAAGDDVPEKTARAWHGLASIEMAEGNYPDAREKFTKLLEMSQQIGDRAGEAATWHQLATIDLREGKYPDAREKTTKSLVIEQQIGNRSGEAASWHQLATIDLREGKLPEARKKFTRSMEIILQVGNRAGEAAIWHQLASIDLEDGNYPDAREKFTKSLVIKQQIGDRAGEASTWHQLATIDMLEGKYADAREKFTKSLELKQQIGNRAGEAASFYQLGQLAELEGQPEKGIALVALGYLIDKTIGHGDMDSDFKALSKMAAGLGYDQQQLDRLLEDTWNSYQLDHGRSLIAKSVES